MAEQPAAKNEIRVSRRQALAVVFGGVLLLALCNDPAKTPKAEMVGGLASQDTAPTIPKLALKTTPAELKRAYDDNEVAAQTRFDGQVIEVKGIVAAIMLDATNDPMIVFESGDRFNRVQAGFDKKSSAATAALKKGQTVTVRCQRIMQVISRPVLIDCVLLP